MYRYEIKSFPYYYRLYGYSGQQARFEKPMIIIIYIGCEKYQK
jgi:hypothetical protein